MAIGVDERHDGGAVLSTLMLLQNLPHLLELALQIFCSIAVYIGLMIFCQKTLVVEIKNMILNRGFAVAKE